MMRLGTRSNAAERVLHNGELPSRNGSDGFDFSDSALPCSVNTNGHIDEDPAFDEICRLRIGHGYVSSPGDAKVVHVLLPWGVYGETADYLVEKYEDRILRQVNWLPYRSANKPSGLLITAIEQNYTQPHGMTPEETAEVEQLIGERRFYMPPDMMENPVVSNGSYEDEYVDASGVCKNCREAECGGCVPF